MTFDIAVDVALGIHNAMLKIMPFYILLAYGILSAASNKLKSIRSHVFLQVFVLDRVWKAFQKLPWKREVGPVDLGMLQSCLAPSGAPTHHSEANR